MIVVGVQLKEVEVYSICQNSVGYHLKLCLCYKILLRVSIFYSMTYVVSMYTEEYDIT